MGKIDDMRRLREQQFADSQQRKTKARPAEAAASLPVSATAAARSSAPAADAELAQPSRPTAAKKATSSKSGGAVGEQGKCSVCMKMKPLSNGVLAQHQKGFGKACAGSRHPPVG